jgi:hypothetical protein
VSSSSWSPEFLLPTGDRSPDPTTALASLSSLMAALVWVRPVSRAFGTCVLAINL